MAVKTRKNSKGLHRLTFQNVVISRLDGVAASTGFSYSKMHGRFAGTNKRGRNEVTAMRVSTVIDSSNF